MKLSRAQLASLVVEWEQLQGAQIQKITQPSLEEYLFHIRVPGKTLFLLFSSVREEERLHLIPRKFPSLPTPSDFCMSLRKHLLNSRILSFELLTEDRIILMQTKRAEERHTLIFELIPRRANLFLCDAEGLIKYHLKPLSQQRGLKRNQLYTPPDAPRFASKDKDAPLPLLEDVELIGSEKLTFPFNSRVAHFFEGLTRTQRLQRLRQQALKDRRARLKKLYKLLKNLEKDLASCERNLARETDGELLKHQLHTIKRGTPFIEVIDYYSPEMPKKRITLDPKLSPQENLQKIFQKVKRARKGLASIKPRMADVEERILNLEEEIEFIENCEDYEELLSFLPEFDGTQRRNNKDKNKQLPFREYTSRTGHKIWVGRNNRSNDELTFRYAKGNDLWLHARGVPGSHVLIPLQRNEEVSQDLLIDAATLAAYFSKAREENFVEIMFTQAKYVRKPKGQPPGQVSIQRDNNLQLRVEKERLAYLLRQENAEKGK